MNKNQNTLSGLRVTTVLSAFQKVIRRGLEHEALWYGTELYLSRQAELAWQRMRIIVSEDIGLANPNLPAQVEALYKAYTDLKAKKNRNAPERLQFIHALILIVRSPKSRLVDNKLNHYFNFRYEMDAPEYGDYVFDKHTLEGKEMGRGFEHFFDEGAQLVNVPEALAKEEAACHEVIKNLFIAKENKEKESE